MSYPTFQFVSGPYAGTYNGAALGATSEGFGIRMRPHVEPIKTDQTGEVAVDGINLGTEYDIELEGVEFAKVLPAIIAHPGIDGDTYGNIGSLQTANAKTLVLAPLVAGTGKLTYTATKAICETDIQWMMNKGLRKGRVVFHLYPDPVTGKAYTSA